MLRKIGIGLLALLVGGAIILVLAQRQIGQALFTNAVERNAGVDQTAGWDDGLYAIVCGSGSPMPDAQRAGPCIAVIAGKRAFVFDAGSGSIRKLQRTGFPMDRLDAAFLTHLHSDHIDGLGELMLQAWMAGGRDRPLPIYGPPGTDTVIDGFTQAYAIDRGYRIAHHGPGVARPGGFGGEARIIGKDGSNAFTRPIYNADGVTIRAIAVDHAPVDHSYAFRIEYAGRAIVISGDTKRSDALASFARGADVIFHEALNPDMVGQLGQVLADRGNADAAKIMADIPDYHTTPAEAAKVAETAGSKALVLYHLVPAPPVALIGSAFLGDARTYYKGRLELAEDGMLVRLPAGSDTIEIDSLL